MRQVNEKPTSGQWIEIREYFGEIWAETVWLEGFGNEYLFHGFKGWVNRAKEPEKAGIKTLYFIAGDPDE